MTGFERWRCPADLGLDFVFTRVKRSDGNFDCTLSLPYFDELCDPAQMREFHTKWVLRSHVDADQAQESRDFYIREMQRKVRVQLGLRGVILVREKGRLVARSEDRR